MMHFPNLEGLTLFDIFCLPFRSRPLISVIIACGNKKHLDDTLASIHHSSIRQSKLEVVIVCDPIDRKLLRKQTSLHLKITPVRILCARATDNHGARWDKALGAARGRYAFILDEGTCIDRECLELHARAISSDPDAIAVLAPETSISEDNRRMVALRQDGNVDYHSLLYLNPVLSLNALFHTERLQRIGGFDQKMPGTHMPAYDLWIRLSKTPYHKIWLDADVRSFSFVEKESWHLTKDVPGLISQLSFIRKLHPMDMSKSIGYQRFIGHSEPGLHSSTLYHEAADPADENPLSQPAFNFSQSNAVETQSYAWEKKVHFHLKADRPYWSLRFDPVEKPVRIQLHKVSFRFQKEYLAIETVLIGNGQSNDHGQWDFKTDDPSIIIQFKGQEPVWIDECIIELEWLDENDQSEESKSLKIQSITHPSTEEQTASPENPILHIRDRKPSFECGIKIPFSFHWKPRKLKEPLAVLCHAFHTEYMPEIREYLENIHIPFDLYLTTDTEAKVLEIQDAFHRWSRGRVKIKVVENRGRDIAPKLLAWPEAYQAYGLMLHIHTKKTNYYNHFRGWRKYILRSLLGSGKAVSDILAMFSHDEKLGMVAPMHYYALNSEDSFGQNLDCMKWLAARMDVSIDNLRHIDFPAGSMFWARTDALRPLLNCGFQLSDFPEEMGQRDGTIAHAIERLFFVSCEAAGFEWSKVVAHDSYPETTYATRVVGKRHYLQVKADQFDQRRLLDVKKK